MARQMSAMKLSGFLEVEAAAPLDGRTVVPLKSDLFQTANFPYPYEGMTVYVKDEKKSYMLLGEDVTLAQNWRETTGEILDTLSATSDKPVSSSVIKAALDNKADRADIPASYDDTALAGRITEAENKIEALEASGYDDTALSNRVTTIENALDGHTVAADVPSNAMFTDTVYDDTALSNRVATIESAGYQTAAQVDEKIATISGMEIIPVAELPEENIRLDAIYLVPSGSGLTGDLYDEYIYINDEWERIGTASIDLSGYATTADIAEKANSADLAAVATSGDYNDLINVPTTSGGGAIPAYIVGDTMLPGWLSLEENGTALEPVNYQEYIILSSGEWLRKHVMWDASKGVYRLTGKVEVSDELQREILRGSDTPTQSLAGDTSGTQSDRTYTFNDFTLSDNGTLTVQFSYLIQKNATIHIKVGATDIDTVTTTSSSEAGVSGTYNKTFNVLPSYKGQKVSVTHTRVGAGVYGTARVYNLVATHHWDDIFYDYETDDVLDITLEELEEIWASI